MQQQQMLQQQMQHSQQILANVCEGGSGDRGSRGTQGVEGRRRRGDLEGEKQRGIIANYLQQSNTPSMTHPSTNLSQSGTLSYPLLSHLSYAHLTLL